MRLILTSLLLGTLCTAAIAQDQPNTILVIDGSGSMWGQIDGIAKITIAQEVVSGLLEDFPADQGLGLTVYGHRERGNCTDIETLVAPALGTAAEIVAAVNAITPLGKTPMTDAVIEAANALRYTEDSATVILVSDGVETCNPDPCAAARVLEEAGIDFTAHVVGFDVSDPVALAQMQCLADETGGQFLTASNADELDLAMTAIVMEPAPEPEPSLVAMTFTAVIGEDKTLIETPVLWDINDGAGLIIEKAQANPFGFELPEGAYTATAYSIAGEETGEAQFIAIIGGEKAVEVTFAEKLPTARIIAPATAQVGSTLQVGWDGPGGEGDYVGIGKPDASGAAQWRNFFYVTAGNPSALLMPTQPGDYAIKYFLGDDRTIIAETPISLTPAEATIDAPAEALVGADISVGWTGPAYDGDYIGIGPVGATGATRWTNFFYLTEGSPQNLTIPTEVGDYEISYFLGQDREILTTVGIAVSEVGATITPPSQAEAGSVISVDWTGPNYDGDYIGIGAVDATGAARWDNFFYTQDGSPANLTVPTETGNYLIQYFLGQDREILATVPFEAIAVSAALTLPTEAIAGSTIAVAWTGPAYDGDYIGVGAADASGAARWDNFFYLDDTNPQGLLVPMQTGDYLVQYFLGQDRAILATETLTVTPVKVDITAPSTAIAGSTVSVDFAGPNYDGDFIGIGEIGASGSTQWAGSAYTEDNTTVDLQVPVTPGDYLVQYFSGQDRSILKTVPITVTAVEARLVAPDSATGGSDLVVGWDGPDYTGDFLGIGLVGAEGSARWEGRAYTRDGNPLTITLPDAAGDYLIQYFLGQGRTPVASLPLKIE